MSTQVAYPAPGEILANEFMEPMGITAYRLAKDIGVPQARIGEILAGRRAVTVDTALRLSRYFGTTDGFWTALQTAYDLRKARAELADELARIVPRESATA